MASVLSLSGDDGGSFHANSVWPLAYLMISSYSLQNAPSPPSPYSTGMLMSKMPSRRYIWSSALKQVRSANQDMRWFMLILPMKLPLVVAPGNLRIRSAILVHRLISHPSPKQSHRLADSCSQHPLFLDLSGTGNLFMISNSHGPRARSRNDRRLVARTLAETSAYHLKTEETRTYEADRKEMLQRSR